MGFEYAAASSSTSASAFHSQCLSSVAKKWWQYFIFPFFLVANQNCIDFLKCWDAARVFLPSRRRWPF
jgi:hypothetical protein